MDPARFTSDLARLPDSLNDLASRLDAGLPGLAEVEALGAQVRHTTGARPRVLMLGMGSSNYAADVVAREARQAGGLVVADLASTQSLPEPAEDLIVIAVSATGNSVEVVDIVRKYTGTGRLIALTNSPDSRLQEAADLTIGQYAGVEESGIACRTFRHTLVVLRAIVAALHEPDHAVRTALGGLSDLARTGATAAEALLTTQRDWLEPVAEALDGPMGTWVLAPMERFSSSRQSALMLREIPRKPAFASETGDWSHVDLYLTKTQDYRALFYAGSIWDEQALEWMTERGSTWVSVGAGVDGAPLRDAAVTVRYPGDDSPRVAQLAEVLVAETVAGHWFQAR